MVQKNRTNTDNAAKAGNRKGANKNDMAPLSSGNRVNGQDTSALIMGGGPS